ncbi:hypothetical protein [Micromonospora sp. LOL_021]|uniref:hypothetical protein n=1 Tax=Micromonospora sp. LOL_021 TaxID=3345417 RepID=UPI003A85C297
MSAWSASVLFGSPSNWTGANCQLCVPVPVGPADRRRVCGSTVVPPDGCRGAGSDGRSGPPVVAVGGGADTGGPIGGSTGGVGLVVVFGLVAADVGPIGLVAVGVPTGWPG